MSKLISRLMIWFLCTASFIQASDNNVLAPNAKLSLTLPAIGDFGTFSFLGEIGDRNLRGSGTYGVYFTNCQRFKVSGEYLTQKLDYDFFSYHQKKWVSQYAVGGAYQYLLPKSFLQSVDLGASYSHAFRKNINQSAAIAGSDGAAGYIGSTLKLWKCAFLSATANYDYVKYHRQLDFPQLASGWGGSVNLIQQLPKELSLTLSSEFRKPFYFYEGKLNWQHSFPSWGLSCGLYGNYTDGKSGLPNVTAGGLQISISFGGSKKTCCRSSSDITTKQAPSWSQDCYEKTFCDLKNWVSSPAVYVPVVLAIVDRVQCTAPPTSSTIPAQDSFPPYHIFIDTSPYFHSDVPLTFSATGLLDGLSIDPSTGVISGTPVHFTGGSITVTASSACGTTSQSFELGFEG